MELLPDLVLLEVFSFLGVEERFATLRVVCRRWRQIGEFLTQNDLVVYGNEHPLKKRWPSNNRQLNLLDMVGNPFFDFCLLNGRCKAIKRLFFGQIDWNGFQRKGLMAELLCCLCQLEELSIDQAKQMFYFPDVYEDWRFNLDGFNLPNLRVLSVKQYFRVTAKITAPRLEKLVIWDFHFVPFNPNETLKISISHPERLRSLQCQQIDEKTGAFSNLVQLSALYVKRDFDLSHMRKLKRLDLCLSSAPLEARPNFHETIEGLIKQRSEMKLNDLEITNFGSKHNLTKQDFHTKNHMIKYLQFCDDDNLDRFVGNFTSDYLPWNILFYSSLRYHPEDFNKLARSRLNIDHVKVSENVQPDPNLLIKFMVQIGGVQLLTIDKCSFGAEFYDQLTTVPYIAIIVIYGRMPDTDFNFLNKISFLNGITLRVERFAINAFCLALKKSKIQRYLVWVVGIHKKRKITKEKNTRFNLWPKHPTARTTEFDCLEAAFAAAKKQCKNKKKKSFLPL